ncbi:MAG TPA: glycosyltransferase [Flavobacterium sp.]|jgi:cellulose synthase/poly-beta-1,6-N-acetylglucosamine synthase-like glycosyltransferase
MEAIIIIFLIYFVLYIIYIGRLFVGYGQVKQFTPSFKQPDTRFSILIPFRNEADNLPRLLESIKNIDYPNSHFEIILINDFSDDHSESIVYKWRVENGEIHTTMIDNVRISGSPKKDALTRAVPIVVNEWIVTTDADCVLPEKWLRTLNDYILATNALLIAGPVVYDSEKTFLQRFQQADLLSLQAATVGSFGLNKAFMCNGANLAYKKSLFNELNGFRGNNASASGDDVFILQKAVAQYPEKVHYLLSKEALVLTRPAKNMRELFLQRVRWASKAATYNHDFGEMLALVVFLGNFTFVFFTALAIAGIVKWEITATLFIVKFIADYSLLLRANRFFRNGRFIFPVVSSLIYPFFSTTVALYSMVWKYEWKGRKFR